MCIGEMARCIEITLVTIGRFIRGQTNEIGCKYKHTVYTGSINMFLLLMAFTRIKTV